MGVMWCGVDLLYINFTFVFHSNYNKNMYRLGTTNRDGYKYSKVYLIYEYMSPPKMCLDVLLILYIEWWAEPNFSFQGIWAEWAVIFGATSILQESFLATKFLFRSGGS